MKFYKQTVVEANPARGNRTTANRKARGGGAGKKENVRGSGVYPSSGPWPKANAEVRAPAAWNKRTLRKRSAGNSESNAKVDRAVQGAKRKIKSKLDEAYQQGESARKARPGQMS